MRKRLIVPLLALLAVSLGAGPATAAPHAGTRMPLNVWLERGPGKLWLTKRTVPRTPGVAAAAVRLLFAGPNAAERPAGVTPAIPAGTSLRSISITNSTATIDVSRAFVAAAPATRIRMRLAQLTFSATQFPTVKRVRLEVAGAIVHSIAGAPVPQPAVRSNFLRRLPAILVARIAVPHRAPDLGQKGEADTAAAGLLVV